MPYPRVIIIVLFLVFSKNSISQSKDSIQSKEDSLVFLSVKTDLLSILEGDLTLYAALKRKSHEFEIGALIAHENFKISQFESYDNFDFLTAYEKSFFSTFFDGYGININYNHYFQFFDKSNIVLFLGGGYKYKNLKSKFEHETPSYTDSLGNFHFSSRQDFSGRRSYNDFSAYFGLSTVKFNVGLQLFGGVVFSSRKFNYPVLEYDQYNNVEINNYSKSMEAMTFKVGLKIFAGEYLKMSEFLYGPED